MMRPDLSDGRSPSESATKESVLWTKRGGRWCPGQGPIETGLGLSLYKAFPAAQKVFDDSDKMLGIGLTDICFNGPTEKLRDTRFIQLATAVTCMAANAALLERYPQMENDPSEADAGISLGEFSILPVAKVLPYEVFLPMLAFRASVMHEIGMQNPGRMATIVLPREEVLPYTKNLGVEPAILSYRFVTISGPNKEMDDAVRFFQGKGARLTDHVVDYQFHNSNMKPAEEEVKDGISAIDFRDTESFLILNNNAQATKSGAVIKEFLPKGITSPVDIVAMIQTAKALGVKVFLGLGPAKGLMSEFRRGEPELAASALSIHDGETLNDLDLAFSN